MRRLAHYDKIPKTADGQIIYPGMSVYVMTPFSVEKVQKATVYCVLEDRYTRKPNGGYCVLEENREYNGEWWEDGNTEHTSRVFADENACHMARRLLEANRRK